MIIKQIQFFNHEVKIAEVTVQGRLAIQEVGAAASSGKKFHNIS